MPKMLAALPNIGGAVCSTLQSLADAIREIRKIWKGATNEVVGRSSPHCQDMWKSGCCLTSLFYDPTKLSDDAKNSDVFMSCICSEPRAAHSRPAVQICIKDGTMCGKKDKKIEITE